MEFGILLKLISPFKSLFGWMIKKRKLTILTWKQINCDAGLEVKIVNTTLSPIIMKEINFADEGWEQFYEEAPLTIYVDEVKINNEQGVTVWRFSRVCDPSYFRNGTVKVKDINNKVHKSKHLNAKFWAEK